MVLDWNCDVCNYVGASRLDSWVDGNVMGVVQRERIILPGLPYSAMGYLVASLGLMWFFRTYI